ncbi:hypothetical protein ASE70_06735 [Sphingomonas sp. Leaf22]|uniref:type II toxin-antitoxin system CcdA family antitoxin n=1 Tax=Sphingomonas sp. Leaf22 TaxID=1735687 RepID=UPI0006F26752|nr:type II toxin-antitoxin system CcdA family antitoxin [Sphingomonas sp. Leaf22]KQM77580.1 hypothetical protein ASE70_06735 [Sphingomonas sp. Leaf22]
MTISTPAEPIAIDAALLACARAAGVDVTATCHGALVRAIEEAALAAQRAESAAAIAEWNDWAGSPPTG